jgi:hypothetical protein
MARNQESVHSVCSDNESRPSSPTNQTDQLDFDDETDDEKEELLSFNGTGTSMKTAHKKTNHR